MFKGRLVFCFLVVEFSGVVIYIYEDGFDVQGKRGRIKFSRVVGILMFYILFII